MGIRYEIRSVVQMLASMNVSISHVYREGNIAADWLANIGMKSGKCLYFDCTNLPKRLRGIVRIDRCGLPCITKVG